MSPRKTMRRPKRDKLDKILESLPKLQPVCSHKELDETVAFHESTSNWAWQARRLTLAVLTMSGQRLMEMGTDEDKGTRLTLAIMSSRVKEYREWMAKFLELLKCADARLGLAMCYCTDMEELMTEAERILACGNDPDPCIAAFPNNVIAIATSRAANETQS